MFCLYLKSSRSLKDSNSQASQEGSLQYTKLNGHSIKSLIFIISLVEISIDVSPPCPHSIAGSPSGNLVILRSRLHIVSKMRLDSTWNKVCIQKEFIIIMEKELQILILQI